jgi:hypothetical protein
MDAQSLPAEVDEILLSRLSQLPLTDRMWEVGQDAPMDVGPEELLTFTRAAIGGLRAAVLRLAEEIEALKTEH